MAPADQCGTVSCELVSSNIWFTWATNGHSGKNKMPLRIWCFCSWNALFPHSSWFDNQCEDSHGHWNQTVKTPQSFKSLPGSEKNKHIFFFIFGGHTFYRFGICSDNNVLLESRSHPLVPLEFSSELCGQEETCFSHYMKATTLKLCYCESFSLNTERISTLCWRGTTEESFPVVCHKTQTGRHSSDSFTLSVHGFCFPALFFFLRRHFWAKS